MRLKKIGAVLAGAAILCAALTVSAGDRPTHDFWVNADGTPAAMIVVGEDAAASDVVSASLITAKVGTMAVKTEEMKAPVTVYWDKATNIPLAYSIPDWEATIPWMHYNVPGSPEEINLQYYKTWGITTHWTPDDNAYVGLNYNFRLFGGVRVEYTIGGLWFFDEDSRTWFYTRPDGAFEAWETHEEIQIRFDDLYLEGGKEFALSGYYQQDHIADLAGGDVAPESFWESGYWKQPNIPGLIYRIDNIRRPLQIEVAGYSFSSLPDQTEWVDTHGEGPNYYYLPSPEAIRSRKIPRIALFGREYEVVDATFLWDYDMRYKMQDASWKLGSGYVIITGKPHFYLEQYVYEGTPSNYDGYEIAIKDVDEDHNKVFLSITTPAGDTSEFWMVVDPMHGFSPTPQHFSQTGEATEYTGWSHNDLWFWTGRMTYRDGSRHSHLQYSYPLFAIDGIATFVGTGGINGALFDIYTLSDVVEFETHLCCTPYFSEPHEYSLWIDQQNTADPCVGNYFSPSFIAPHQELPPSGKDIPNGLGLLGDGVPGTAYALPYNGPWRSIDSHCTTTAPIPPSEYYGDSYSYTHFIESVPDGYMDRDPNDYLWLYEDGFRAHKNSHMVLSKDAYLWKDTYGSGIPGGDFPLQNMIGNRGADYMWEMNFALCDTVGGERCMTKYVINGPHGYFHIEVSDVTWDDGGNGWVYVKQNGVWVTDAGDDGIDFSVVMEVSKGTYTHSTPILIDPASLVKLDVEVKDEDVATYNLVLVGGPVVNAIVKRLIDIGAAPDDGSDKEWMRVYAAFKLYTNGFGTGRDVLVVAGPDREETRRAAEELVAGMG